MVEENPILREEDIGRLCCGEEEYMGGISLFPSGRVRKPVERNYKDAEKEMEDFCECYLLPSDYS